MARKLKEKLDYFSHSATTDNEEFEAFLNCGVMHYYIYYRLRELICIKGGYYIAISDTGRRKNNKRLKSIVKDASIIKTVLIKDKLKTTEDEFNAVIEDAFTFNAFNKDLYNQYGVLTSKEIQEDYIAAAIKRKQIKLVKEFILFDIDYIITNYGAIVKPSIKNLKKTEDGCPGVQIVTEEIQSLLKLSDKEQNSVIKRAYIVTLDNTEYDKPFAFANNEYIIFKSERPKEKNWGKVYSALELALFNAELIE